VDTKADVDDLEKERVLLSLEIDTQFLGCPTHSLVTMRILEEKNPHLQR
jgi:hypothetical protein